MLEAGNHVMTGFMALGVAWLFIRADADSATSRALSAALALTGLSIFTRLWIVELAGHEPLPAWSGLLVVTGAGAFIAAFEWTVRVRRTLPAGHLKTRFGDVSIRIAQALIVVYATAAIAFPGLWIGEFLPGLDGHQPWPKTVKLLFATPVTLAMMLWLGAMILCLNRRPEPAERVRLIAVLLACPLAAAGLVLPLNMTPLVTTIALFILLAGAMRHAQLIGQRGQFLSRFLSPQVAHVVNRDGLHAAMRETELEVSVVCVDLRGFTAFASAVGSEHVLALLRDYYDAVGAAASVAEGTIKDYAGDGVLILVGAPVSLADHADRALSLARQIRQSVAVITERASTNAHRLGVGVGIASGRVTVGIIGGEGRLEYAAVGEPVNLASRLCDQARDGEILLAKASVALIAEGNSDAALTVRAPLQLKGFEKPIENYALAMV